MKSYMSQLGSKIVDFLLKRSQVVINIVRSIDALTAAVRDLTKAVSSLANIAIEDRNMVMEMFALQQEMMGSSMNPDLAKPVATASKPTPIETILQEKKTKKVPN